MCKKLHYITVNYFFQSDKLQLSKIKKEEGFKVTYLSFLFVALFNQGRQEASK